MVRLIKCLLRNEDGVTAVEYGLIAACIAVVITAAIFALGNDLSTLFLKLGDCMNSALAGSTANC